MRKVTRFPGDDGSLKFATDAGVFVAEIETQIPSTRKRFDSAHELRKKPLVFLCFGQSNAANHGDGSYMPRHAVFCFNIFDGNFYVAEDPVPGATGNGACPWGRLGDLLVDAEIGVRSVLFVNIAVGGSYLAEWTPGGPHNRRLALAIERMARADIRVERLLWCQGEAEANHTEMARGQYKEQFHAMLQDIRGQGIDAPVHVAQSTFCATAERSYQNHNEIREAIAELIAPAKGILRGPDTDAIGLDGRSDGCHFNELGLQRAAKLWFDAVSVELGMKWKWRKFLHFLKRMVLR